jgi:hypothetical protein
MFDHSDSSEERRRAATLLAVLRVDVIVSVGNSVALARRVVELRVVVTDL